MDSSKPARASMLIGPRHAAFTRTILLTSMMMNLLMILKPILKPILIYSTGSVTNPLVTTIRKTIHHMNLSRLFMPSIDTNHHNKQEIRAEETEISSLKPDEYGIFRDNEDFARALDGRILHISKEDVTDVLIMAGVSDNVFN